MSADDRDASGAEPYRAASGPGSVPILAPRDDPRAASIAQRYGLLVIHNTPRCFPHLVLDPVGLSLASGRRSELPFRIDWAAARTFDRNSPLLRAIGYRAGIDDVVDATAGLGRDGALLARAGCRVRLLERAPWLIALLDDALERHPDLADRLELIAGDSVETLSALQPDDRPQAIYIDPMLEDRPAGAAAVKKEIRILKDVLGPDRDAEALLAEARRTATRRVVVKRPLGTPPLGDLQPDAVIRASRVRWDVFLVG